MEIVSKDPSGTYRTVYTGIYWRRDLRCTRVSKEVEDRDRDAKDRNRARAATPAAVEKRGKEQ